MYCLALRAASLHQSPCMSSAPRIGTRPPAILLRVRGVNYYCRPPLLPRRSRAAHQPACAARCCLHPVFQRLGLRGFLVSGLPLRSLMLRPGDSLTTLSVALSIGFRAWISLVPAIQATGRLACALAGLSPAERFSLCWTHGNRAAVFQRPVGVSARPRGGHCPRPVVTSSP